MKKLTMALAINQSNFADNSGDTENMSWNKKTKK